MTLVVTLNNKCKKVHDDFASNLDELVEIVDDAR